MGIARRCGLDIFSSVPENSAVCEVFDFLSQTDVAIF